MCTNSVLEGGNPLDHERHLLYHDYEADNTGAPARGEKTNSEERPSNNDSSICNDDFPDDAELKVDYTFVATERDVNNPVLEVGNVLTHGRHLPCHDQGTNNTRAPGYGEEAKSEERPSNNDSSICNDGLPDDTKIKVDYTFAAIERDANV